MQQLQTQTGARLCIAAIVLATAGGVFAMQLKQSTNAEDPRSAAADSMSIKQSAEARLVAAERVCKMLHDRMTGAPRGHEGVEHTYVWSMRRMNAEIEVERDKEDGGDQGVAAIQRHVDWMRAWNALVRDSGAYSGFDIASTDFYIAEAEDLLARARAK